ncbi:MAG TPA: roadblock/LC7 domain-containing protein [bacterium]|nr:roadblock/LC7 domain-containing protein [bacterium]HPN42820.1 roadblock/LC7 domain-containing protein [bacterium]
MIPQQARSSNGKRMVFSETMYHNIIKILADLRSRLQAQLTIFADMNGYPIAYDQDVEDVDIIAMTALAAGTFAATAEMAKLVKEKERFRFIYHEGVNRNIYMCNVSKEYIMIILFDKSVAMGMVRILTHNTVEKLEKILEELAREHAKASQFLDVEFKSLLGKELDKYFGIK